VVWVSSTRRRPAPHTARDAPATPVRACVEHLKETDDHSREARRFARMESDRRRETQ
jgi:hypothetical protein